ncbi:MAG TPA: hypothetical protein VKP69_08620 [Isosphaeraceae bacterium]|nr:hypothetical protein [Isosphaeraceae bacterium]
MTSILPSLGPLEIANVLLVGERRKRCMQADTMARTGFLASLLISVDGTTTARAGGDTLNLARAQPGPFRLRRRLP